MVVEDGQGDENVAWGRTGNRAGARMSEQEFLDELKAYVGFTAEHASVLSELGPLLAPGYPAIVERFYEAVQKTPRAVAVFSGGQPQIDKHKGMLRDWLGGLTSGVYDLAYLEQRARIGRAHVRIKLEQRYMLTAMNLVREGLHEQLEASAFPAERRLVAHGALDKICDLELAIMLETYAEDSAARLRDRERLATLGQVAGFVGHELRNPLAVMETSLHLLKKRLPVGDEHAMRHVKRIAEQVALSAAIISDLLELARDRPVTRTTVNLDRVLHEVVESLPDRCGASIEVDVPARLPTARLDEQQLRHLVSNLVTNACQAFTGDSVRRLVAVRAAREGEALVVSVDDSGPGISADMIHRLFEPLATTKSKGLGLGLALCRRIAKKHAGDIRAVQSVLGGARFEARLNGAFPERAP
jgi:two-component system sensor histidine kinase HydH